MSGREIVFPSKGGGEKKILKSVKWNRKPRSRNQETVPRMNVVGLSTSFNKRGRDKGRFKEIS